MSRKGRQRAKSRRQKEARYLREHKYLDSDCLLESVQRQEVKVYSGFKPKKLHGRTPNQIEYIQTIKANDITLCSGPPGVGKTFVAAGMAAKAFRERQVEQIVLTRPAVEAGASLGFLPGTLENKLDPYLAPLFDELSYFIEAKFIKAWMEHKLINIVPLNFMRGRTFNNAFVIVDEAQNALMSELLMCLTRIGMNSKMVIQGDLLQSDLPPQQQGGFQRCINRLQGLEGVGVCNLGAGDIIRHPLIAEIERRLRK